MGDLTTRRRLLPASTPTSFVDAAFREDPQLSSVIVGHDEHRAVLISRSWFYEMMAGRLGYGWALNQERPISALVDRGLPADRVHAVWKCR